MSTKSRPLKSVYKLERLFYEKSASRSQISMALLYPSCTSTSFITISVLTHGTPNFPELILHILKQPTVSPLPSAFFSFSSKSSTASLVCLRISSGESLARPYLALVNRHAIQCFGAVSASQGSMSRQVPVCTGSVLERQCA